MPASTPDSTRDTIADSPTGVDVAAWIDRPYAIRVVERRTSAISAAMSLIGLRVPQDRVFEFRQILVEGRNTDTSRGRMRR